MEHLTSSRKALWANLALIVPTIVWASNFTVVHEAMRTWATGRYTFLACRFWIATIALGFMYTLQKRPNPICWRQYSLAGGCIGVSLIVAYITQTTALAYTTASKTAFITSMNVVLVPIGSTLFLRQRVGWSSVIGVLIAAVGLALLCLQDNFRIQYGDLLSLVCAMALAADVLLVWQMAQNLDPLLLTGVSTCTIAIATSLASIAFEIPRGLPTLNRQVVFSILFTGVVATALCFWIQAKAQRHTSATHAALIFSLEPAIAAVIGYLWSNELFTLRMTVGALLILCGTILTEIKTNVSSLISTERSPIGR